MSLDPNSLIDEQKLNVNPENYSSDQEARWCPGCGDYSILAQMKKVLPQLGIPREKFVFVSGIGCSSRFPYYLNTYGVHGIHGRAPAIASGIKIANPDLSVFVITGDGDALSIGGNHFIHICRRNIDITVILFNNKIYGLTKGQYSPTSNKGMISKSSPYGTIENPFVPVEVALAAGATFVARTIDREPKHMVEMLTRAARHKGTSFVEVYQNCPIFNDGVYSELTDPKTKKDKLLIMEDGKPYIFGQDNNKALNWNCNNFEVMDVDANTDLDNLIKHEEHAGRAALEFMLVSMTINPDLPTPIGIFRDIKMDTYEDLLIKQINDVKALKGEGSLEQLFNSGNTWMVNGK
ncbi:MAG: 2-oxoacid:ferredoxin oxidoreductase subunit beta [Calditrichaceae bacterium]|nr:2-oxoacid:ferredoxin oxidoreductase subunit beta [Calditrichaceae bacterium]MBN2708760.1 2-oxoacid:ferredoxin oxidoreductase subunit beta [Calditrichaceae bacterium]RQV97127.1 MAG: 2-oxoacid:ferredoxin oxidoreductase subunit beta [Calditrichota bacterium]